MNIHIVCRDLHEDKILPRLAKTLAKGNGWSLSEDPRKDADLNYWMVYIDLAERHSDWHHTPITAYFSHYEKGTPFKEMWWKQASGLVDGCILTAVQYENMLPASKQRYKVTPPVDLNRFYPIHPQGTGLTPRRRVGVSGFVDRSGRKGADLVAQLAADMPNIDFIASGEGWPVPTQYYPYDRLVDFYNSLDTFVCTASIEGIPLPPLEALACGIPLVIPEGVGMLDELPSMRAIRRYKVGNYDELRKSVELSVSDPGHSSQLRDAAKAFDEKHWCEDHATAFAGMLGKPRASVSIESDRHGQRGVFYVAYGAPARDCAKAAIESFKHHMPGIPVALASDVALGAEDLFIPSPDEDIGGRSAKTQIYSLAPREWQYILYLDADTELIADISYLYQLLEDGFDFVICKNPGRYHTASEMKRSDNTDECEYTFNQLGTNELIQLNGGVFAFQRNSRTEAFFACWHEEWKRWGKRDQGALLRSLFKHPLKMMVLGNEWNTITRYDSKERSAGILHYPMTARRWRGTVHDRSDSAEAWNAVEKFQGEYNAKRK